MKTVTCEVCGKEFSKYDKYIRDQKTMCHDCAILYDSYSNRKKCYACGKKTFSNERLIIQGRPLCYNCAFKNGKADYDNSERYIDLFSSNAQDSSMLDLKPGEKIIGAYSET